MSNRITQYRPAFLPAVRAPLAAFDFDTVEQLLRVPFVQGFRQVEGRRGGPFFRFSAEGTRVIAEYAEGSEWSVVGYLARPLPEGSLPAWAPRRAA